MQRYNKTKTGARMGANHSNNSVDLSGTSFTVEEENKFQKPFLEPVETIKKDFANGKFNARKQISSMLETLPEPKTLSEAKVQARKVAELSCQISGSCLFSTTIQEKFTGGHPLLALCNKVMRSFFIPKETRRSLLAIIGDANTKFWESYKRVVDDFQFVELNSKTLVCIKTPMNWHDALRNVTRIIVELENQVSSTLNKALANPDAPFEYKKDAVKPIPTLCKNNDDTFWETAKEVAARAAEENKATLSDIQRSLKTRRRKSKSRENNTREVLETPFTNGD